MVFECVPVVGMGMPGRPGLLLVVGHTQISIGGFHRKACGCVAAVEVVWVGVGCVILAAAGGWMCAGRLEGCHSILQDAVQSCRNEMFLILLLFH